MAVRLSELHPSLVHFPIALLPVAIGADAVGRVTGRRDLLAVGRVGIVLAAASTALAGVFGFIAQEEVDIDERAHPVLATHRTLNIAALGLVTALAVRRVAKKRPSAAYLLAGAATVAAVTFSGYLGGKLVYAHGAGVAKANGIYGPDPEILPRAERGAARTALADLVHGVEHTARDMAKGTLVPALRGGG